MHKGPTVFGACRIMIRLNRISPIRVYLMRQEVPDQRQTCEETQHAVIKHIQRGNYCRSSHADVVTNLSVHISEAL